MVAIGTGTGVGLERSSTSLIGSRGQIGSAGTGRSGDSAFVNAANGNLVITRQDEFLVGLGPDAAISRTYNSQSTVGDGDNNDQWRMSAYRQIIGTNGAATLTRVDWDGSETVYFQYATNGYATYDGAGPHDWMVWNGTAWTWTDGTTGNTETYDASGKLTFSRDTDGNTLTYAYSGSLLASITNQNGERTDFVYGGTGGAQLQQITTVAGSSSVRVRYSYDASNRLSTVTVDLSPGDGSIADGKTYVTTYTYDGASKRVASIGQSDGSLLQIGYANSGADYRVVSLTETVATGVTRVTGLYYDVGNRTTRITDPAGGLTTMTYDIKGNLTQVVMPVPAPGAAAPTIAYTYAANGDLLSMTEDGRRTDYEYDLYGNLTLSRDAAGNTVARTYDIRRRLLTSTLYLVPDPDGAGAGTPLTPVTTRYVYDAALESHLRFAINAEGDVIEYQYNAAGQLLSTIAYTAQKYDVSALASDFSPSEATMASWAAAIADKSSVRRTDTTYDGRGNVWTVTRYSAANADGAGLLTADYGRDTYVYSAAGQLLSRINNGSGAQEVFVYDGLGRVTSATDMANATTTFLFTDTASAVTTTATFASGLTRVAAYNKAGELISVTESGANVSTAVTNYYYDGLGRLRMETNPAGNATYYVYDNAGRKVADITADGAMTEYAYEAGRLVKTIGYVNKLTGTQISQLAGVSPGGAGGSGTGAQGISGAPTGSNLLNNGSFETSGAGAVSTGTGWSNTTLPSWTKINSQNYEQVQSATGGVNATDGTYWLDLDSVAGAGWVTVGNERMVNGSFETAASDQDMTGWVKVNPEGYQRLASGTGGIAATNGSYWLDLDSTRQTGTVAVGSNLVTNGSFETAGATDQSMPGWVKFNPQPFQQLASGTGGVAATNGTYWLDLDSKYQTGWAGTGANWLVNGSFEQMGSSDQELPGWTKSNPEPYQQLPSGTNGVVATDGNLWLDLDSRMQTGWSPVGANMVSNGSFENSGASYGTTSYGRLGTAPVSWTSNNTLFEQVNSTSGTSPTAGSYWLDLDAPTRVGVGNNLLTNGSFEQVSGTTAAISGGRTASAMPGWTRNNVGWFETMSSGTGGVTATDGSYWLDLDVAGGVQQGQDMLVNGSFEQVSGTGTPTANGALYTSMPGWTISNSGGVERVPSGTFGMAAADGAYFLDMDGQASNADISQIVRLTASQQFTISLSYANTAGTVEGVEGPESSGALWVYWNGNVVGSIGSDEAAFGTKTFNVTGLVGNNTLRLREMGVQNGRGVSLDNVKLIAGPQQASANLFVSQQVTGLTAGQVLQLSFDHASRAAGGTGSFYVTWNGQTVASYDDATATMQTSTLFVVATAGTNILDFRGTGTADNVGASIDNVRLLATQAAAPTNIDVTQKIRHLLDGYTYRIQFDHANRTTPESGSFDVLWNGALVASVTDGIATMQTKSYLVTALGGDNLLRFRGTGTADDVGASLDNVKVTWMVYSFTPNNMDISQAVPGLAAGQKMELSFDHANRTSSTSGSFEVLWNDQIIDSISSAGTAMLHKTYLVTAAGGNDVLRFRGTGPADDFGASIDNVRLLTAQPVYSTGNMDVRQTVPNLAAGQAMQLKFDYANRTGAPSGSFEVLWNGVAIDTVTDGTVAMKPRTYDVTAVAGDNVIGFRGIGTVDDVGASIDNVQLYATQPVMTHGNMDIRQTVSGLAAGKMQLQFDHANRTTAASGSFDVYWNGNKIASINSTGTTMLTKTYQVDALAGDNILRFVGTGTVDDNGASIDNVRLLAMVYDVGGGNMDISQSVTVGTAGLMQLMFDHANRTTAASGSFDVYWNGDPIASISSTGTTMLTKTFQVAAVAGTNTVRFVGTGTVDALGASIDNVRLFATQAAPSGGGTVTNPLLGFRPVAHADDRYQWNIYDSASRLVETIDGTGAVTRLSYDGASRLVETRGYANLLAAATVASYKTSAPTALALPAADAANDRVSRSFYRKDGLLAGTLDGEGYLSENVYDGGGLLIETIRYANATVPAERAAGSLATLKAGVAVSSRDIHTWYVHDGRGLLRGKIDGEGNLTRYHYTAAGDVDQQVRGQKLDPAVLIATRPTFASLPTAAGGQITETTSYTRDPAGKVTSESRLLSDGTSWATTYGYDPAGRLTSRTAAQNSGDARTFTQRFDARGNLIGELGGEGSAALAALGANPAAAAVDNVYATWGTTYSYDSDSRLISRVEANGVNAAGNRTLYYYDAKDLLALEVNARGEAIEYRYNARGERTDTIAYGTRIAAGTLAGLNGGQFTATVQTVIAGIANASLDSLHHVDYNVTGTARQSIDPLTNTVAYDYNAFGELKARVDPIDASSSVQTVRVYDRRGILVSEKLDAQAGGLQLETLYGHDAFGRPTQVTDPSGRVRKTEYDRAGRIALTIDARNATQSFGYDGRGNVISITDRNNRTTTFSHDAFSRTITSTTPGLITTTIKHNAHGETVSIKDGALRETVYAYDKDGNLRFETDAASQVQHVYDSAGRLKETIDGRGSKTSYTYDAVNRILTEKVNDGGLNLVTAYEYDPQGRKYKITDPANRVTLIEFDKAGRRTAVVVDSAGLAVRTQYDYDKRGRALFVTEAAGTAAARITQYEYDKADRLLRSRVDPSGLNLLTQYSYDNAGNVARKTDAANFVTTYAYDAENRLTRVLDPEGGVVETYYDEEGRVAGLRRYANAGSAAAAAGGAYTVSVAADNGRDQVSAYYYDVDGRLKVSVDGGGRPTEYVYDNAGNVIRSIDYGGAITFAIGESLAAIQSRTAALASHSDNRTTRAVYDAANRRAYSIDPTGQVTAFGYDGGGNVTKQVRYANVLTATNDPSVTDMAIWASNNAHAGDRVERTFYDGASRATFSVDAENYVTQHQYDLAGRTTKRIRHASNLYSTGDGVSEAGLAAQIGAPQSNASITAFAYDSAGRLTDTTDPENSVTHLVLDALGQATDIIAAYNVPADSSTTHRVFDKAGRVQSETRAYGTLESSTTTYSYDGMGRLRYATDPYNVTTEYIYDALGRCIHEIQPLNAAQTAHTYKEYDKFGNLVKLIDPRGNAALFHYDALDRLVWQTDPEGYVTKTTYTTGDEVASVTRYATAVNGTTVAAPPNVVANALDATTSFERDKLGRLKGITDAELKTETYTLNAFGDRIAVKNKIDGTTANTFDKRGLLLTETLPVSSIRADGSTAAVNVVNKYDYDARGNRIATTESYGIVGEQRITNFVYDKADRLKQKIGQSVYATSSPTGGAALTTPIETYNYDARGNLIETVTSWGARTLSYYDDHDRKTAEIQASSAALGTLSKWDYDLNGNVKAARVHADPIALPGSPGGTAPTSASAYRETLYTYDANNRRTHSKVVGLRSGEYASGYASQVGDVVLETVYDHSGNVVQEIDGRLGSVFSYYDRAGRKIAQVDQERYLTFYTLDGEGNVKTEERFASPVAAADINSLPANLRDSVVNGAGNRITQFTYDRNGRRTSETRVGVNGHSVSGTGQLQAAGADAQVLYEYNGLGQVVKKTEANLDVTEFGYDALGRQTWVQSALYTDYQGSAVRRRTETAYNGLGSVTRSINKSKTGAADRVTTYTYGAGGRLEQMKDAADFVRTFSYDAAGNVVREAYSRANSAGVATDEAQAYRYDLLNRVITQSMLAWNGGGWSEGVVNKVRYNSFGEITGRGLNADANGSAYQETFDYDSGGRMWRSTSGDGSVRLYGHDKAGNANLVIASAGDDLTNLSLAGAIAAYAGGGGGVATTVTLFDKRGQGTTTFELQRQIANGAASQLISTSRSYNAFGEVRQESDAFGKATDYTYNTAGKLTKRELPTADYTTETGAVVIGTRAAENYSYDLSGRLIGIEDAYGNDTTRRLLAGTGYGGDEAVLLAEYHPDDGVATKAVDEFGDVRTSTDEILRVTGYTYDKMGRLTELAHAGGLIDSYRYDGLGQRTQHWNSFFGSGVVDRTDYDSHGRVTQFVQASGTSDAVTVSTAYSWDSTRSTGGLGTFGGWVKTTTHGGRTNNNQSVEVTDYFGNVIGKTDLGGRTYAFGYDSAGRVIQQTSSASQNLTFTYFNTGKIAAITDSYVNAQYSPNSVQATFAYDLAGNRTFESYSKTSYVYDWNTGYSTPFTQSLQAASVTYDELGRMKTFDDTGATGSNPVSIDWEYDRVGNVRRVLTTFAPVGLASWMDQSQQTTDHWYTYDSMNRMVQVMGYMANGAIHNNMMTANSGFMEYDKAGQRKSRTTNTLDYNYTPGKIREEYIYTPAGQLDQVTQSYAWYSDIFMTSLGPYSAPVVTVDNTRDGLGRLTGSSEYSGGVSVYSQSTVYNVLSQVTSESTFTKMQDNSTTSTSTTYDYRAETWPGSGVWTGEYQGGVVTHAFSSRYNSFTGSTTSHTTNSYVWWDEAKISTTTNTAGTSASSVYSYDENGKLASVSITGNRARTVQFVTDLNGQVMSRTEYSSATDNPKDIYYYFNGLRVGDLGNHGPSETDYSTATAKRGAPPQNQAFDNEYNMPSMHSDFDQSFTPMGPNAEGNSHGGYIAREGDTLRTIAQAVWGDADMWYLIGEANGLSAGASLTAGQRLRIPAKVTNIHNNSETFRVYDPNKAIGDNSPSQVAQAKPAARRGGCGMLGTIILIAVAVAITLIIKAPVIGLVSGMLQGTALAGAATVIGAAATGAIASVVSQGVGLATGIQEKFSWKGVAMSALSAGISQGVGSGTLLNGAGKFANDVARGALVNAATQGVAVATGLQKKFDWAGIAVAGVVGGVTGAIGRALPSGPPRSAAAHLNSFVSRLGGAVAGAATRSAITGTSFGDNILATLPDVIGTTIGNLIGEALVAGPPRRSRPEPEDDMGSVGDGRVSAVEVPEDEGFLPYDGDGFVTDGEMTPWDLVQNRIAAVRRNLDEADWDNPLMYALSDSIPLQIKRDLWARYQSGDIQFDREVARLPGHVAEYDDSVGVNGIARFDEASLELVGNSDFGELFGAVLAWGDLQEQGAQLDAMAWRAMGVAGGDSPGDEGAMFALLQAQAMVARNGPSFTYQLGELASFRVDSAMLASTAMNEVRSGTIWRENRVGNVEHYGPAGHYHTTFLVAHGVARSMGKNRVEAYRLAAQLALGSQLPDMIGAWDAKTVYLNRRDPFGTVTHEQMLRIHSRLHSLLRGPLRPGDVARNRLWSGRAVSQAIRQGDYAMAGLLIHNLGDSYSHTRFRLVNGRREEMPFQAGLGHAGYSGIDNMYSRPGLVRQYVSDLAGRIADGLAGSSGLSASRRADIVRRGTYRWTSIFNATRDEEAFTTRAARTENQLYQRIGGARSGSPRPLPTDAMGVDRDHRPPDRYRDAFRELVNQ